MKSCKSLYYFTSLKQPCLKLLVLWDQSSASWLVTEGVPLLEVNRLLGHSTVKMTERYAHLAPDRLESAVSLLDHKSRFGHVDQPQILRRNVSH